MVVTFTKCKYQYTRPSELVNCKLGAQTQLGEVKIKWEVGQDDGGG